MSIAGSMLEAVRAESARHNAHVLAVGVKIGELSGVESESLRFCFDALVQDTDLAPLALEIEWCRAADGRLGDELQLAYLDLEDVEVPA